MCGRYSLQTSSEELAAHFEVNLESGVAPRYNIAPSQGVDAVIAEEGARKWVSMQWGLLPSNAPDPHTARRFINARAETVFQKPTFRDAALHRPCLIPADGFYEWAILAGARWPRYFTLAQGGVFAFAGVWEAGSRGNKALQRTCSILTTTPNSIVQPVHDRMPVILSPSFYSEWLDTGLSKESRLELLRPLPDDKLAVRAVSSLVNSPRNETPRCIELVVEEHQADFFES